MTHEQRATLSPTSEEYYKRVRGSQTQLFGWLVYTVLLWSLKLCWLFFFRRLGDGVDHMTLKIKYGFVSVGITFLGTFFTILCSCWPIKKKWQIYPDPGSEPGSFSRPDRASTDNQSHCRYLLSSNLTCSSLDSYSDQSVDRFVYYVGPVAGKWDIDLPWLCTYV